MHSVKIPRTGITADEAAEMMRHELGDGYQARPAGPAGIKLKSGPFHRARVVLCEESDGTVFQIPGQGIRLPIPLFYALSERMNDQGIAKHSAETIGQSQRSAMPD
jgi:hypothetical protein